MPDIQEQMNRVRDAANDIAGTASGKLKEGTGRVRESAGELIQTGRDKAADALSTSREKAGAAYSDARDKSQRAAARANEIIQEHPVAATAAAVAAGALIAYLFPKSRRAMKAIPGVTTALAARAMDAALAARTVIGEGSESVRARTGEVVEAARESAGKADLGARASRAAEDAMTLVADKAEALAKALKDRLPKA